MHRDCTSDDASTDACVLELLLDDHPGLWSVDEVSRMLGDPVAARDALDRLTAAGLVHRCDGYAFASRAAAHSHALPR
jgi:predicted ArsR family transcriptional regulator